MRDVARIVLAVESVQIGSLDVLFVALALAVLRIGDAGVGVLNAALGLGGIVGAAVTARLVGGRSLRPWLAIGAALWGAGLAAIGLVPPAVAAIVIVGASGAGRALMDVAGRTLLQRTAPPAVLARALFLAMNSSKCRRLARTAALARSSCSRRSC